MHILVLSDRDWTHPQAGGTGTNLHGQVVALARVGTPGHGHRLLLPGRGAARARRRGSTIHRIGGRSTVFPRAIWRQWRGLVPDADVVLEVMNGISFLTPLWLRTPRVVLVHHIHRDHYVRGAGPGRAAWRRFLLETAPLQAPLPRLALAHDLRRVGATDIAEHGIPRGADRRELHRRGAEALLARRRAARERAHAALPRPAQALQAHRARCSTCSRPCPRPRSTSPARATTATQLEAEIEARGLGDRRAHARLRERGAQARAAPALVGEPHRVVGRGLVPDGDGGRRVRDAERRRSPWAACRSRSRTERTGLLADDAGRAGRADRARCVRDRELRERLGAAAPRARAASSPGTRTARRNLDAARGGARARAPSARRCASSSPAPTPAGRPGWPRR